jgi:hypothetical protein
MDWQKKIDELVVGGARVTENGRLDFPSRLPFCPDRSCRVGKCVFWKLGVFLKGSGRIWEDTNLAIGKCKPTQLEGLDFPDLYSQLDNYSEDYYKEKILPIILRFYEEGCLEELFNVVWPNKKEEL